MSDQQVSLKEVIQVIKRWESSELTEVLEVILLRHFEKEVRCMTCEEIMPNTEFRYRDCFTCFQELHELHPHIPRRELSDI